MHLKVSVVAATFNRGDLLDRALATYHRQTLPPSEWEYVLADDGSTDNTREVVKYWQDRGVPIRIYDAGTDLGRPKVPGQWRDGCGVRNAASTFAHGQVLVSTHPEILLPPNALEAMYQTVSHNRSCWVTAIPYWLPPTDQLWKVGTQFRDEFDAFAELQKLRSLPGFYDPSWPDPVHSPGAPDYRNQNQEARTEWESEVFWAMEMGLWRWLGGFREFDQWGSVDMDFVARRRVAGIPTVIARQGVRFPLSTSNNLMVFHQHHESKRDMDLALQGVQDTDYSSVQRMREQGGLYGVYQHGHRERAIHGLHEVLRDHVMRYEWAASFAAGQRVLDAPCGTGYGAELVARTAESYFGLDIDAESIEHAKTHHNRLKAVFQQGTLTNLPYADQSLDLVLCFEGLEHVEDHAKVIAEFWRVLKPGGRLLLSTPQKGATGGTPWDRYMVTRDELRALFGTGWIVLEAHQRHYGGDWPVTEGHDPQAEIMLVMAERI